MMEVIVEAVTIVSVKETSKACGGEHKDGSGDTRDVLIDKILDEWPLICSRGVQNLRAAWHKPGVRHVWLKTMAMADSQSAR